MVSRKDFFKIAASETVSFLQTTFSELSDTGRPVEPAPAADDDLLYEAMALGIDPATVEASQLAELVARARSADAAMNSQEE